MEYQQASIGAASLLAAAVRAHRFGVGRVQLLDGRMQLLVDGSQRFSLGQRVMMLRPSPAVRPEFLMYQLMAILAGIPGEQFVLCSNVRCIFRQAALLALRLGVQFA